MNEVLRVTGLGQSYNGSQVLHDVAFSAALGERLAVLGPSGSGKTTLLRLIAGLEAPRHGAIVIAGQPVSRPGEVLLAPEHRGVALVFQGLALFPHLNALEQIAFAARGTGAVFRWPRISLVGGSASGIARTPHSINSRAANVSASLWPVRSRSSRDFS